MADRPEYRTHILSAMTAGATSAIATNPIWVVKTRLMVFFLSSNVMTYIDTIGRYTISLPLHSRLCSPYHA